MTDQMSVSAGEVLEELQRAPERRERWGRLALARAAADAMLDYRVAHRLSQRRMAERLEMKPSQVARIELAEHNPSIETLQRLARVLGIRFVVDVAPAGRSGEATVPVGLKTLEDVTSEDGGRVLVAAG